MNGMIFAAGLGTRLRPLTNDRPKAMVEVGGKPLLEHVILKMKNAGICHIVVNVHHYADMIEDFLKRKSNFDIDILISDERDCLLDTGGALRKARGLFLPDEPVLIHNVDILSDIDLWALQKQHEQQQAYITLVTQPSLGGRVLKFNDKGVLKGWENKDTGEQKIVDDQFYQASDYSFCGIHIVSPAFLEHIIYSGVFSVIDEYIAQAKHHNLQMFSHTGLFMDLGTPEAIAEANSYISIHKLLVKSML